MHPDTPSRIKVLHMMHERPNQKQPPTGGSFEAFRGPWIGNRSRIKSLAGIGDFQNEIVANSRELD